MIQFSDIKYKLDKDNLILSIPVGPELESFKVILNRALNCFPEAPPEYKHLSDILNFGVALQDYYEQAKSSHFRFKTGTEELKSE